MITAVCRIMWLRLWRDKGALVLAFVLPGFIFAVFAAIFSNASGGNLDLRVALARTSDVPASVAFVESLRESSIISVSYDETWTETDIANRVRLGQDDVGVVIFGDVESEDAAAIRIIQDPSRQVAATVLEGQLRQKIIMSEEITGPDLFQRVSALGGQGRATMKDPSVTYYIGATAILFLLFSAMQGAAISIDERRNGISDRLMVGPAGAIGMLTGKFVFLSSVGFVQAALICVVAALAFDVPITTHLAGVALACAGTAMFAAGIALLTAAFCNTQAQMHTVSTFAVLLLSAVGGSMVPRFMMPSWLQELGQLTPNYWSIEAFYGILARGQTVWELLYVWGILFGGAFIALALAALVSHKLMRV